ncbi:MAG: type II toxin-antitoxin system RelE/ParE family toxin [Rhodospirillales bacterium]
MKLRWTRPALHDLEELHSYIADRDPAAALQTARLLRAQAEALTTHPQMGRAGRIDGTRELVVAGLPFIIAYRVTDTTIDVLAIRHGRRDWPIVTF